MNMTYESSASLPYVLSASEGAGSFGKAGSKLQSLNGV